MVGGVGDLGPFKAREELPVFPVGGGRPFLGDGALRGNRNALYQREKREKAIGLKPR